MQGYFDNAHREYVLTDMKPRRHLYNYLWNEETVCKCDQFGNGFTWMAIGTQRRDIENGERNVYVKDKGTGEVYSANRNYNDLPFTKHEAHIGLGYHTVLSEYKGLETQFTILIPEKDSVTLFRVQVKNLTDQAKDISLYFCIQPRPALSWHDAYGDGDYSKKLDGLLYTHDGFNLPNGYTKIFVGADKKCDGYDVSKGNFYGIYNGCHNPVALQKEKLGCKGSNFEEEYVAALAFDLLLEAGEEQQLTFCAFAAQGEEEILSKKNEYLGEDIFQRELEKQRKLNEKYLDVFMLNSPDEYLNTQVNIWLKRQLSLGKTWGRLYGKGFRDVMQDITAFVSFDAKLAKERILYALAYQYEDGNPIRMFEPNFRYPYNDGGVWITGAVLSYINESGDIDFLQEELPYLKGDSYENASFADSYSSEKYVAGKRRDSALAHVESAIQYLLSCRGKHNLVLWRGGDWNDSLNNAGVLGKGESVWLSIATVKAVNELQEILMLVGDNEEKISAYETQKQELKKAIQDHGYNGEGYIYGINDHGEKIGDKDRLFLNPQTWSVLAGLEDKEILEKVMDGVEAKLRCDYGYLQCYPSFDKGSDRIGRVSYFKKGLVENGAVYNHGVAFKIAADCMLGRGDKAYQSLKMISYDNPKNPDNGVEPYAVSNMYMGPENPYIAGYAPMSWITGTAGWLYRCVTEYICGIKAQKNGLKIRPCFPSHWDRLSVKRKFRNTVYDVEFIRSNKEKIVVDGEVIDGNVITCKQDETIRRVTVYFV